MPLTPDQIAEIDQQRTRTTSTRRATVPELEDILGKAIPVLDHGFIRVVDYMGDDGAVVQAARVSYGAGTKKVSDDRGLIRYLMRHRHSTPFEMCELKLHVKLPIFVARQWVRHRTANINEYSARYSILDKEFYVPDAAFLKGRSDEAKVRKREQKGQPDMFGILLQAAPKNLAPQSSKNKQGREGVLSSDEAEEALRTIRSESGRAYTTYMKLLNEGDSADAARQGLARELARMVLPTNYYTQWYWKIDLHNLLHFLSLRADPHAQYEIRVYAEKIAEIVARWVPHTWHAFENYRLGGANLSAAALMVVKRLVAREHVDQEESGLNKREWADLMEMLGRT
jgi:thymidylate synthase (FAD)